MVLSSRLRNNAASNRGCSHRGPKSLDESFIELTFLMKPSPMGMSAFLQLLSAVCWLHVHSPNLMRASLVAQTVKNLPAIQETWVPSLGQEDPLEEKLATLSRILTWRIPRTEEPGGLQSMRSQRARHDWETNPWTHTQTLKSGVAQPSLTQFKEKRKSDGGEVPWPRYSAGFQTWLWVWITWRLC